MATIQQHPESSPARTEANRLAERPPVIEPGHTYGSVTDKIASIILTRRTPLGWFVGFGIAFSLLMLFLISVTWLFVRGVGIWGLNVPVGWAFDITNFVWWVGIGHAGTLISAILLLLRQEWRTSINRFAEAMTLFAVACAGMFPILHLGRPWLFYWLFPYPNSNNVWTQFRSPLIWDVFAVSTYATVSLLFWYVGLVPDLATLRDRATNRVARFLYGVFALGWRGSARHWHRYHVAYLLLAALATPLVASVHTIVSFDFAVSVLPGWHTTIFPPYFVAGAIFSGFAMVLTLTIPIRKAYGLEDFVTMRHLDNMAKVILATGLIVAYGYLMEAFAAWYSANQFEQYMYINRLTGPYWPTFAALIVCNILIPQALWFRAVRSNILLLWIISLIVNVGMWLERFVIIVLTLHRDFVPAAWDMFTPTFWDWSTYLGTIGLFLSLLFLFIRVLPMISIFEMRELVAEKEGDAASDDSRDQGTGIRGHGSATHGDGPEGPDTGPGVVPGARRAEAPR
jgi:Ni/Fe-hydrogenase subunit HybB-like protein